MFIYVFVALVEHKLLNEAQTEERRMALPGANELRKLIICVWIPLILHNISNIWPLVLLVSIIYILILFAQLLLELSIFMLDILYFMSVQMFNVNNYYHLVLPNSCP